MVDFDIYCPDQRVEKFLSKLKLKLNKDCPQTKVYMSAANSNNHWLYDLYKRRTKNETSI